MGYTDFVPLKAAVPAIRRVGIRRLSDQIRQFHRRAEKSSLRLKLSVSVFKKAAAAIPFIKR